MLAGGFRKKYLRATSRLLALTDGRSERAHHHVVVLDAGAEPKCLGAVDREAVLGVKALRALVVLIDAQPHALGVEVGGAVATPRSSAPRRRPRRGCRAARTSSTARRRGAAVTARCDIVVVGHTANQHGVAHHSAVRARGEHQRGRDRRGIRRNASADRFSSMNAAMFSGVTDGGQASGKVRAATSASSARSASTAAATLATAQSGSGHVPLGQVLAGDCLSMQHHVGHQVAVAVPPHAAGDRRACRRVLHARTAARRGHRCCGARTRRRSA